MLRVFEVVWQEMKTPTMKDMISADKVNRNAGDLFSRGADILLS
jgi:hypothetical protein